MTIARDTWQNKKKGQLRRERTGVCIQKKLDYTIPDLQPGGRSSQPTKLYSGRIIKQARDQGHTFCINPDTRTMSTTCASLSIAITRFSSI